MLHQSTASPASISTSKAPLQLRQRHMSRPARTCWPAAAVGPVLPSSRSMQLMTHWTAQQLAFGSVVEARRPGSYRGGPARQWPSLSQTVLRLSTVARTRSKQIVICSDSRTTTMSRLTAGHTGHFLLAIHGRSSLLDIFGICSYVHWLVEAPQGQANFKDGVCPSTSQVLLSFWFIMHDRCWTAARRFRHGLRDSGYCV